MDNTSNKKCIAFYIWLAASACNVSYVQAKDEIGLSTGMLDEIVVTARKREESLQETPVAISAFSSEALRDAGISTMRDLTSSVPGLTFVESGSKAPTVFLRGIGQKESNAVLDPSVGVYINGLYIARTDTQLFDTLDTESIQVLRGPQGTLFGKNTTAGAMLVTTKSPTVDAFSGSVGAKVGNYGRRDAKLFLNIPLNEDSLAMRASINSVKRDGYMKNVYDGKDYGDEDRLAATARFLWEASDVFSADLFTYMSKQNENGGAFTCVHGNPASRFSSQLLFPGPAGTSETGNFIDACHASEALADDNKLSLSTSVFTLTNEMAGLTLLWDMDDYEFKSITGFGHQQDIVVQDDQSATALNALSNGTLVRDYYLGHGGISNKDETRRQLSQEFNFVGSAFDESLSYTIGVFYSQETMDHTPFMQALGPGTFALVSALASTGFATHTVIGGESDLETKTSAFFSQGTYDVTDWFQVTVGARWTSETRERDFRSYEVDLEELAGRSGGTFQPTSFVDGISYGSIQGFNDAYARYAAGEFEIPLKAQSPTQAKKTWTKFTPAVTFTFNNLENYFDSFDSAMTYITYSKGFKAGGFEPLANELRAFDPEEVTNYEVGFKLDAMDNHLRVNGALYYMDYTDLQVRVAFLGDKLSDIFLYLDNAGEATIKGGELELTAIPVENLTVAMTFNYTDAAYDEFVTLEAVEIGQPVTPVDRKNEPYSMTPKKSGSLSISYNVLSESAGMFIPRLTAYHRDKTYVGMDYAAADFDQSWVDAFTVYSARLTWLPSDSWNVTAFVDNLADKDYYQGGFSIMGALGSANLAKAPPRTYGLEAYFEF